MRNAAAHHAGIGLHGDEIFAAAALENAVIGVIGAAVVALQVSLRGVEGIGVLHRKFTHADQTASCARLIAELRLNLVDHEREIGVGLRGIACEMHRRLLMGHAEHHRIAGTVLPARHLAADARIAPGFLPERCGHDDREHDLLTVDRVHLLADNLFNFARDALCRGKQRENAVCHVFHIAAAHHQRMAFDDAVLRGVLEALTEHCRNLHGNDPSFRKFRRRGGGQRNRTPQTLIFYHISPEKASHFPDFF